MPRRRGAPKSLKRAISAGFQPMFMTADEVKANHPILSGEYEWDYKKSQHETPDEVWARKLRESKMTGEERYGRDAFEPGRSLMYRDLRNQGIKAEESLESESKRLGAPPGFLSIKTETGEIAGGHHRIALSSEQFKDHVFPIKYYPNVYTAKEDPEYT